MTASILCAFDGTDHARRALSEAADLAKRLGAELSVCVVNVQYGHSPRGPQASIWTEAEASAILAEATETLATAGGEGGRCQRDP
jgi:nucleotide-binding universal stress UspA family protein